MALLACLLIGLSASAYDFMVDGLCYNYNSDGTSVTVTYEQRTGGYSNLNGALIIPETVTYSGTTYSVTTIGFAAFYGCSGLTSVTIPKSVATIDDSSFGAFENCSGLESMVVASGNTKYDSRNNCNGIIETATNTLFAGCKATTIPNSVTSIGKRAFSGCTGLTLVAIPNSVTSIGDYAFLKCTGLTSVTIPNSVTSIGDYAFLKCTGLTSVTIPNSVTEINAQAFSGCSNLADIYSEISNPTTRTTASNAFQGVSYSTCKLHIPDDTKHMYVVTTPWNNFENMIGTFDYFEFVDKDGNVVPNEATLTLTEVTTETDVFTGEVINIMYSHLKLRNKITDDLYLRINMAIERIDNGSYQICFPVAKSYDDVTNIVIEGVPVAANELKDLQTEWIPTDEGGCDVTLTVEVLNRTGSIHNPTFTYLCDGPTVTLHYRNGITDPVNGDINSDGMVDILDVNAVINCMLGRNNLTNADVNGDGVVDIFDVNNVVDIMLFGKTDSIPTLVSINKALDESGEPTFDWNNAKDYVILTVGEAERDAMEGKIVADYNIDSMTRHLYVWENTYVDGDCSGINSFGQLEDHIALTVGNVGWSGFGMIQDGGIDFSMLDDTYVLHFAMKAKSTDMTSHGFGFAQAKFTIGPTAFFDGARVHKLLGDIEHNGEWYYIDIPFSVLRQCADNGDVFPEAKGGAAAYNDNHLWCLSGGVAGSELHIDNIFFYKKKYNQ